MHSRKTNARSIVNGTVIELFPDDDYGYILTQDQQEIRFHPDDMKNRSFARLRVGSPVHLVAVLGNDGTVAATQIEELGPHAPDC
jgi:cold shock CspA family protein